MSTEVLMMLLFAALTVIAYMIAMNAKGIWRLTLSFLLATCMLGGTVWLVILQFSANDRSRIEAPAVESDNSREPPLVMGSVARASSLIAHANGFAALLQRERLMEPDVTHDQLVKRAVDTEYRLEMLQTDVNVHKQAFVNFPESLKLLTEAMNELKQACRLYRVYYFAENAAHEQRIERDLRQRARNAQTLLAQAEEALGDE